MLDPQPPPGVSRAARQAEHQRSGRTRPNGAAYPPTAIRPVPGVDRLEIFDLPGSSTVSRAKPLGSEDVRLLIEELRASYDLIVIDTAPVLIVEDANWLSPLVDAVLLVVRFGRTTERGTDRRCFAAQHKSGAADRHGAELCRSTRTRSIQEPLGAVSYPRQARAYFVELTCRQNRNCMLGIVELLSNSEGSSPPEGDGSRLLRRNARARSQASAVPSARRSAGSSMRRFIAAASADGSRGGTTKAVLSVDNSVTAAGRIGSDDGATGRHRLHDAARDALAIVGGQHKDSASGKVRPHVRGLAEIVDHALGRPAIDLVSRNRQRTRIDRAENAKPRACGYNARKSVRPR